MRDRLTSLILLHWTDYQPSMLAGLRKQNRLEKELELTADQIADLMYELISVSKLEYLEAYEMAMKEYLTVESSLMNPSDHPETSALPKPIGSGWAVRMKKRAPTSKPSGS